MFKITHVTREYESIAEPRLKGRKFEKSEALINARGNIHRYEVDLTVDVFVSIGLLSFDMRGVEFISLIKRGSTKY